MKMDKASRTWLENETGYRLMKLIEIRCVGDSIWETSCEPWEYMIWIVKEGEGCLKVGETGYTFKANGFGPLAGSKARLIPASGMVHGYLLIFAEAGSHSAAERKQPSDLAELLELGEWPPALYNRLIPLFERLCRESEAAGLGASMRRGRLLYTMLEELSDAWAERQSRTQHDPIAATRSYMENHYDEDLSRDRLANIAQLSPWHYSVLFKQETGMSPMAYLAEVRIRNAKESLLRPDRTLRQVAREAGYRDEFYFSRKFRNTVGVSPTIYVKKTPERLANLCFPYDGNIMALQMTPYMSIVDQCATHRSEYFRRIPHLLKFESMTSQYISLLRQANPYLILCGDDQDLDSLSRIAPTVSLPWRGAGWREHLLQIGGVVRKEKESERWLAAYDENVNAARVRIRRALGYASCIAVALAGDELIAYRSRNMGELLYRDLQITDPYDKDCPSFIKRRISLEELHRLNPDCLLLHVYSHPQSGNWVKALERNERWQSLRAVRERRTFRIDDSIWREYSAYSHQFMLAELERIFAKV